MNDSMPSTITLVFNKTKVALALPKALSVVTLADLQLLAANTLGVPLAGLRLIYAGGFMKDPNATLAQYGIHHQSSILVLASPHAVTGGSAPQPSIATHTPTTPSSSSSSSAPTAPAAPTPTANPILGGAADPKEMALVASISDTLARAMQPLNPQLDRFARMPRPSGPDAQRDMTKLKLELAERLMQALLKVDGIQIPPGFILARAKRREAVNTLQGLLDEVEARYRTLV